MRKTNVTRIIVSTRRTLIVRKAGGGPVAETRISGEAPETDPDKKNAMEPRKENQTND